MHSEPRAEESRRAEAVADALADPKSRDHPGWVARVLGPVARWLGPWATLTATLAVGLLIVAAALSSFDEVWEWSRDATRTQQLDIPVHEWAIASRDGWLTGILTVITELAGKIGMPIFAAALATLLCVTARSWRPLLLVAIAAGGSLLLTTTLKTAAGRDRPPQSDALPPFESSPSFPSGHTLNAAVILLIVAYCCFLQIDQLAWRIVAYAGCFVFVLAVAWSRIYLGHHWLTDVVGAMALGAAWAGVVILGHQTFSTVREYRKKRAAH
ncbi:phosphatase PAP2 family protein [Gulosibacter macacae]|uniref:Phosphatase PAP2 family protein n=1 Tax=Gulosibacter macacae TaxID=2488791 RepID=A0A3P3VT75_9MICO|nr:phosphatase PAP2 family protein [Gulosibacter macacae]RRJ85850.1 phosphatase PAP2 family protein [Gulosibacter macacae]